MQGIELFLDVKKPSEKYTNQEVFVFYCRDISLDASLMEKSSVKRMGDGKLQTSRIQVKELQVSKNRWNIFHFPPKCSRNLKTQLKRLFTADFTFGCKSVAVMEVVLAFIPKTGGTLMDDLKSFCPTNITSLNKMSLSLTNTKQVNMTVKPLHAKHFSY